MILREQQGIGAADMAFAVQSGEPIGPMGMAYHVLDIIAIRQFRKRRHIELKAAVINYLPAGIADKLD